MRITTIRPSRTQRAVLAVLASVAVALGASQALAAESTTASAPAQQSAAQGPATSVDHEYGTVLEGSATIDGKDALISVYDNSVHGSFLTIVVGDPEDGGYFADAQQQAPYVVDGHLNATVELNGKTATLTGTLTADGRPTKIRESLNDGGQQIITHGTNTPLAADVQIAYDGKITQIQPGTAFGYDLEVRKVDLYGN